jgi:APA family basic amino acid/polyamine antiporter
MRADGMTGAPLLRGIRRWDLVALVINSVVGAGIFGLPSRAYALAGTYSLVAYLVCAVPVFLIVLCFAEVSSRFENSGGPYLYARATFGAFVGFEIGWLAWLVRVTAFAALCNLFVDYLSVFLPVAGAGFGRTLAITTVIAVLTAANIVGVRLASLVGNVFVIGKLVPLLFLAIVGFFFIDPQSYSFAQVPSRTDFSASVLLLVFAFTGFEIATAPAGEAEDPSRDLPFALITGTAIAALIYVAIQAVCIGTVPELANSERPLADVGEHVLGPAGAAFISLGALISVTGTMNAIMLAMPRILFAMGEQHQLPQVLSATHRRFKTPYVAILVSAVGVLAVTLLGRFASAAILSTIIRLITYAVTCAALPVLRLKSGYSHALFVTPAGWAVSVAALCLIGWLFSSSSWSEARLVLLAAGTGVVLFLPWNTFRL